MVIGASNYAGLFVLVEVGRWQGMLEPDTLCKGVVHFLWEHGTHLPIQGSVEDLERAARRDVPDKLVYVLLREVMHRLVKELHILGQDLMHEHQVPKAHGNFSASRNRPNAELDSLLYGAMTFGHGTLLAIAAA